jgi:hypothetical protein
MQQQAWSAKRERQYEKEQLYDEAKEQLYDEAKRMGIEGRSRMDKAQLQRAVDRRK